MQNAVLLSLRPIRLWKDGVDWSREREGDDVEHAVLRHGRLPSLRYSRAEWFGVDRAAYCGRKQERSGVSCLAGSLVQLRRSYSNTSQYIRAECMDACGDKCFCGPKEKRRNLSNFFRKPTTARNVSANRVPPPETTLLLGLIGGKLPIMDSYTWTGLVVFARTDWSLQYVTEHRNFAIYEGTKGAALFAGNRVF